MGSSSDHDTAPSAAFLAAFRARAGDAGRLRFDDFMRLALFAPQVGYYTQARTRVGYARGTDFYTASTSGAVFGEMVAAACVNLLGDRPAGEFTFVEIGAEPDRSVLRDVQHPFAATREIRLGDALALSGRCVVFSNELFDAQPVRRCRRDGGQWCESFVAEGAAGLAETFVPIAADDPLLAMLPREAPDGYVIDAPLAAAELLRELVAPSWQGVFVAFDYGKSWDELATATPAGTARAYFRHTQSNDLLARPGQQDLTAHVCWDWLEAELVCAGFAGTQVERQETFFVRRSAAWIERALTADAARFSQTKLSIAQLLHPAHLGQKFQVLHGRRLR
ncbi:MAG: SAM-dependent methyltransferase [Opitutus sp.]|nr:SAM-dependent methyltransferase [Opitutus sp.]